MYDIPAAARPTVLVAEPQALPGMWLEDILTDAGCNVSGPYGTCDDAAKSLERTQPDCAVISVDMNHGLGFPLACELRRRGVPFILVSGRARIPRAFADIPVLDRLYTADDVLRALIACAAVDRCAREVGPMRAKIAAEAAVALDQCPLACGAW